MEFKIGDVVQLKSGGPRMTVEVIDEGLVDCVWFEKNQAHRNAFNHALLTNPGPSFASIRVSR